MSWDEPTFKMVPAPAFHVCPVLGCGKRWEIPPVSVPTQWMGMVAGALGVTGEVLAGTFDARARAELEGKIRKHLETHDVVDWVRTVTAANEALVAQIAMNQDLMRSSYDGR